MSFELRNFVKSILFFGVGATRHKNLFEFHCVAAVQPRLFDGHIVFEPFCDFLDLFLCQDPLQFFDDRGGEGSWEEPYG